MTKVLYVEDNDDNVFMLKMRLELLGDFEVLTAEDGEKGCEMACPFRKSHPAWESHRRVESSHDRGRCLRPCICLESSSSTCSSRGAGLRPRTCSFAINSASL